MITAEAVKQLRDRTGAGMMDCKKVLAETNGDIEKAIELLREKGIASAAKKAGRIAAEGIVGTYVSTDAKVGALVEVNSETDFVAKNEDFRTFVKDIAIQVASEDIADVSSLLVEQFAKDSTKTVQQVLTEKVATIGENLTIRRFVRFEKGANNGVVHSYIHGEGRIGVLLQAECGSQKTQDSEEFKSLVKDIAMQIAAVNPQYLKREDVPSDMIEKEKEILKAQALNEGKPAAIVEKMVGGRIDKYYKEICLLEQPFVKDPDMTITQLIKQKSTNASDEINIVRFARFEKGEGIEKKVENFAEEVMKQINN